ncbi:hypothetical protein G6F50_017589 [Rhizopus delemar]|uniref:Uncharacterized protein n=1 Tax=Rhizopus delemar TaxID=936053 RepID=A0A9P6XQ05_9FUNG|nr:hypothetical protein G6F50_017589 [Rhizopus delemar]
MAGFAPWLHPLLLEAHAPGYPRTPLVDLAAGRDAALAAYRQSAAGLFAPASRRPTGNQGEPHDPQHHPQRRTGPDECGRPVGLRHRRLLCAE